MFICPSCKSGYDSGEAFCPEDGTRLVSQSQIATHPITNDPLVGAVLADRWKLVRPIGAGGMGVVYEALHTTLGKRCAVKVLREQVSRDADVVQRFQREAQSASRIGHENIIEIIDFGLTPGGASYMVMELLEGQDLADVLLQTGAMKLERAIHILLQCCRALGAAHEKGIVHRDIKPENVFLVERDEEKDFVKIVDFGIAKINDLETPGAPGRKLTKTGMIFGTPEYMSTEQAYGRPTDERSDVYGLGVIAYEMFTGRVPFEGETFMAVISQHMLDPPPPFAQKNPRAKAPPELEAIVLATMAKDPADRPQSMSELHDQLLTFATEAGITDALPERLTNVSFSHMPPPMVRTEAEASPVQARPTPRRRDLTPGILTLEDEPERPPSVAAGPPWGAIVAVAVVLFGGFGALAMTRPDILGMGEEGARDAAVGSVPPVAPVSDTAQVDDAPQIPSTANPATVRIRVSSEPEGATLRVEGREPCETPCDVDLVPGEQVTFAFEHEGHITTRDDYTVPDEDDELTVPLEEPPPSSHPRRGRGSMGSRMHGVDRLPTENTNPSTGDLH